MRVAVYLLTSNERLKRFAGTNKANAIPKDVGSRGFFKNHPARFTIHAWSPKAEDKSASGFERFLIGRSDTSDATIVFSDQEWIKYTYYIRSALFVVPFDSSTVGDNPQNFFHRISAQGLKAFGQLLAKFDRADDGKLLTLPLRNFRAEELAELSRLCREDVLNPDFSNAVEAQLVALRKRERPRRRSNYPNVYAVDDEKRFFIYGHEKHSRFATGDPHITSCEICGHFRFGKRIDPLRHYNVSETEGDDTSISGNFSDCHGTNHAVGQKKYLNMFPNDYF